MPAVLAVVLVLLLVLRTRAQQPPPAAAPPYYGPGPGALTNPSTGARGGPSTRESVETGIGTIAGFAGGTALCGGNPACGVAGGVIGGAVAPYVVDGTVGVAKGIGHAIGGIF